MTQIDQFCSINSREMIYKILISGFLPQTKCNFSSGFFWGRMGIVVLNAGPQTCQAHGLPLSCVYRPAFSVLGETFSVQIFNEF